MEKNIEKTIGRTIHNILSVEWMRYNMFSTNDIYKNIPMLVFRVNETNSKEQLIKLEKCISDFKGTISWKLFKDPLSKKGNYLLTIAIIETVREECRKKIFMYNEREYFGEEIYKLYCEQAVQDIPFLAEHISNCFK